MKTGFTVLFVVAGVLTLSLVVMTSLLTRSTREIVRDSQARHVAAQLESELLMCARLAELSLLTPGPELRAAAARNDAELRALLREAELHVGSRGEAAIVRRLNEDVEHYLRQRDRLASQHGDLGAYVLVAQPTLDRAVASAQDLVQENQDLVSSARRHAEVVNQAGNIVGGLALLAALLVGIMAASSRKYVYRPLEWVASTLRGFRVDQPIAAAPEEAPIEIRRIANAFHDMAEALVDQRKLQLAIIGGVAHDLRNPLSSLRLAAQVLGRDPLIVNEPRLQSTVVRLERQTSRLDRLLADLLEAARAEAGELPLQLTQVDLREVAGRAVETRGGDSPLHSLRLSLPEAPLPVRADPARLEQAVDNLLSNAIKYSPDGGVIEVVAQLDPDRDEAILSVRDHGVGIRQEDRGRIFAPFQRAPATQKLAPGVGLGLSMVRRIVLAHGGRIDLDSTPGEGATFCIHLPLERVEPAR